MRRYDTDAVSSGGYIDSYSPPTSLGFVKSDWVRVSPPHESWLTEALFCSDDNRVSIDFMEQSKEGAGFRDCVQAGPLLLKKGLPPSGSSAIAYQKLARAVQEQTFICIDGFGQAVIGVTDKTDLVGLTAFLRRPEIGCVDAMRLTGLDTAGMRVGSKLFGRDDYLFPNALGVIRRK